MKIDPQNYIFDIDRCYDVRAYARARAFTSEGNVYRLPDSSM